MKNYILMVLGVLALAGFLVAPLSQAAVFGTFTAVETVANISSATIPAVNFSGGADFVNTTLPAVVFAGGANEQKASVTLAVSGAPLSGESFTIGTCAVTFTATAGSTFDE